LPPLEELSLMRPNRRDGYGTPVRGRHTRLASSRAMGKNSDDPSLKIPPRPDDKPHDRVFVFTQIHVLYALCHVQRN